MKLEQAHSSNWRVVMEFPCCDIADVQAAAMRLFSHANDKPVLRIRDGQTILAKAQSDTACGVLVWTTQQPS